MKTFVPKEWAEAVYEIGSKTLDRQKYVKMVVDNGYDIMLGIEMFARYFDDIHEDLKKKILQEGFTSFNCMVLQNLHQKA